MRKLLPLLLLAVTVSCADFDHETENSLSIKFNKITKEITDYLAQPTTASLSIEEVNLKIDKIYEKNGLLRSNLDVFQSTIARTANPCSEGRALRMENVDEGNLVFGIVFWYSNGAVSLDRYDCSKRGSPCVLVSSDCS